MQDQSSDQDWIPAGGRRQRRRRQQSKNAQHTDQSTQGWNSLATELQVKILEIVFKLDEAIEFAPEPFYFMTGRKFPDSGPDREAFDQARAYHRSVRREKLAPYRGLLTASKIISLYAREILYSKNEFRFSNTTGWMALDHFLYRIGTHNVAFLREITVIHPGKIMEVSSGRNAGFFVEGMLPEQPIWACASKTSQDRKFGYSMLWWRRSLRQSPIKTLERVGKLRRLNLFVLHIEQRDDLQWFHQVLDSSRFANLEKTVVVMQSRNSHILAVDTAYHWWNGSPLNVDMTGEQLVKKLYAKFHERWCFSRPTMALDSVYKIERQDLLNND